MSKILAGQCLCGNIKFSVEDTFGAFYQCHCQQCRQITGSAFASNLFTWPDNIEWLQGQDEISHFEHPTREFSKSFCRNCGSAVPFINKSGKSLVVPAGSLLDAPGKQPQANIFMAEKAGWLDDGADAVHFSGFPE